MEKIYIVLPDYGREGYGTPEGAYLTADEARAAAKVANVNDHGPFEIFELEIGSWTPGRQVPG